MRRAVAMLAATVILASTVLIAAAPRPSQVIVLCTLHRMHEEVSGYSYGVLNSAIKDLHPDVLLLELTPADLSGRVVQKNKREYQNSVYPPVAGAEVDSNWHGA